MSKQNLPPRESEFLLSELNDSSSSSLKDEVGTSKTLVNPSGSGEKVAAKPAEESEEEYEQLAINKILQIKSEVEAIQEEIASYSKEQLQVEFKKFEELLIQKTLVLDDIDTRALDSIRELRKSTICFVQDCLKQMDIKLKLRPGQ